MKVAIIAFLAISACVTPYQPLGFGGGYWESDVGGGVTAIHFKGNGRTDQETVNDYAMQRAAEYCKEQGSASYELIDSNNSVKAIDFDDQITCKGRKCKAEKGGSIKKHTATLYIRCI